jgi:predicted dehydrogenase
MYDWRLSIAVVGCGYWGSKHVRVCDQNPSLRLALAVDGRQDRLDYISSEYREVPVSRQFASVLTSDAAGVILATPISTHFALAKAALLAGKHVLVEKPLAETSAQCQELIAIAEERKLTLMVGHTFEYHPAVVLMCDIIQRGQLGKLHYINSRRLNLGLYQSDTNVLWDLAPHDFSIIFAAVKGNLRSLSAWGAQHVLPKVEDVVYANMHLDNDITAHIHVSWLDPVKVRQVTVVGSEGMLVFDDVEQLEKVRVYEKRFEPNFTGDSFADFSSGYRHGKVHIPTIPHGEPLNLEVLDFANAILTGQQPRASGRSGLRVVEALETASQCLKQGMAERQYEVEVKRGPVGHRAYLKAAQGGMD